MHNLCYTCRIFPRGLLHMQKFPRSMYIFSNQFQTGSLLGTKTQQSFFTSFIEGHSSFHYLNKLQDRGFYQPTLASLIILLQPVSIPPFYFEVLQLTRYYLHYIIITPTTVRLLLFSIFQHKEEPAKKRMALSWLLN